METGTLVLDAVPWGEVTRITDAGGEEHPLGPVHHTPLVLSLPAGRYTITLTNPSAPEPEEIAVEVRAAETTKHSVQFEKINLDTYFKDADW